MTNEELFEDMKQFINTKIDGVENRLEAKITRLDAKIDRVRDELKSDIAQVRAEIADVDTKLDTVMQAAGEDMVDLQDTSKNHETRITKLEAKAA